MLPIDINLDTIGGHPHPQWSGGSCWENEGRFLYKTVREMRPAIIVEIGRWEGCSTSHLALGCMHNNFGCVYSFDIIPTAGAKIPQELRPWIRFINADALTFDFEAAFGLKIDLLLEDGSHLPGFTESILRRYKATRVIVHDYCHPRLRDVVAGESQKVLGPPTLIFFEPPTDCGYGVWECGEAISAAA